jgi:hypothetical protein
MNGLQARFLNSPKSLGELRIKPVNFTNHDANGTCNRGVTGAGSRRAGGTDKRAAIIGAPKAFQRRRKIARTHVTFRRQRCIANSTLSFNVEISPCETLIVAARLFHAISLAFMRLRPKSFSLLI